MKYHGTDIEIMKGDRVDTVFGVGTVCRVDDDNCVIVETIHKDGPRQGHYRPWAITPIERSPSELELKEEIMERSRLWATKIRGYDGYIVCDKDGERKIGYEVFSPEGKVIQSRYSFAVDYRDIISIIEDAIARDIEAKKEIAPQSPHNHTIKG